jgi:hypothetical protein
MRTVPSSGRVLTALELVSASTTANHTVQQLLTEGSVLDQTKDLSVVAQVSVPVAAVHFLYGGKTFNETSPIYSMIGHEENIVYTCSKSLSSRPTAYRAGPGTTLAEIDSIKVNLRIVANAPVATPVNTPVTAAPVVYAAPVNAAPVNAAPVSAVPQHHSRPRSRRRTPRLRRNDSRLMRGKLMKTSVDFQFCLRWFRQSMATEDGKH